jgi:flagellin-like protein
MKQNKKGVSPVISTVLLILIVIVLALIIFLWAKGFVKEAITKDIGGNEKLAQEYCKDIKLESTNSGGKIGFKNIGNVPINKFDLKLTKDGSSEIAEIRGDGAMANPGLTVLTTHTASEYDKVQVIPILLGKGEDGGIKEFRCPESQAITI